MFELKASPMHEVSSVWFFNFSFNVGFFKIDHCAGAYFFCDALLNDIALRVCGANGLGSDDFYFSVRDAPCT